MGVSYLPLFIVPALLAFTMPAEWQRNSYQAYKKCVGKNSLTYHAEIEVLREKCLDKHAYSISSSEPNKIKYEVLSHKNGIYLLEIENITNDSIVTGIQFGEITNRGNSLTQKSILFGLVNHLSLQFLMKNYIQKLVLQI